MNTFLISGLSIIMGACLASLYWLYNKQSAIDKVIQEYDSYVELLNQRINVRGEKADLYKELSDILVKEKELLKSELSKKYGQNTTN